MAAETYTLALVQGETWERTFTFKEDGTPIPLAGLSVKAQVRTKADPSSPLLLDLASYAVIDTEANTIIIRVPANVTAALAANSWFSRGEPREPGPQWDLFLLVTGDPATADLWLQGPCTLDPAATNTVGA